MTGAWNQGGQVGDGLLTQRFPGQRLEGGEMVKDLWVCFVNDRVKNGAKLQGSG